jgi:hypothetical protein
VERRATAATRRAELGAEADALCMSIGLDVVGVVWEK